MVSSKSPGYKKVSIIRDKTRDGVMDVKEEAVSDYEQCIGMFVTIKLNNGKLIKGIFDKITYDGKFMIHGNYMTWFILPSDIQFFSSRPDRFQQNRGGQHS